MVWYFWIGLIASALISIFTAPQLVSVLRNKNTTYIKVSMYSIYLVACSLFLTGGILMVCQGQLDSGLPLVIAQGICGIISSFIFGIKINNILKAKKLKISELEYCNSKIRKVQ